MGGHPSITASTGLTGLTGLWQLLPTLRRLTVSARPSRRLATALGRLRCHDAQRWLLRSCLTSSGGVPGAVVTAPLCRTTNREPRAGWRYRSRWVCTCCTVRTQANPLACSTSPRISGSLRGPGDLVKIGIRMGAIHGAMVTAVEFDPVSFTVAVVKKGVKWYGQVAEMTSTPDPDGTKYCSHPCEP